MADNTNGNGFGIPTSCNNPGEIREEPEKSSSAGNISTDNIVREGGGGFGIPLPEPPDTAIPPDAIIPKDGDLYPFQIKAKEEHDAAIEKEFDAVSLQSSFITGLQKIYLSALVVLASFLGFYTITQTTNFIVQLKGCPPLVRYPLYVAVGIFAFVLLYFIYKLLSLWFKLKQSPQVSMEMLSTLSKRRDLQEKCSKKSEETCCELYDFLKNINEEAYSKTLKSMHFADEDISRLLDIRAELCERHEAFLAGNGRESSPEWIECFADKYQTKLDFFAKARIKNYSYHGGIAATISRIPAMDRLIVLSAMFGLIKDLLAIYNVKPSKINASILLSKVIIQAFCAGYAQNGAEKAVSVASGAFKKFQGGFTSNIVKGVVTPVLEATTHGFLIHRVGVVAQEMLAPVKK